MGWPLHPLTYYPSICDVLSHLFLCSSDCGEKLWWSAFEYRVLGEHFGLMEHKNAVGAGDGKVGHCTQTMTWRQGVTLFQLTSSNAKTSWCVKLVPTFTSSTTGRSGQSSIHIFLATLHVTIDVICTNQKIKWYVVFQGHYTILGPISLRMKHLAPATKFL